MALERPEAGYVWLHVPLRDAVDVVIVGDVHSWWSHWTGSRGGKQNRGVRCVRPDGVGCAWCAAAQAPRVRYVLPVHVGTDLRLVELGRVQYSMLALMEESGGLLGRRIRLVRQWAAKNAPIEVRPLGRESITPEQVVDLEAFVGHLGRLELASVRPPDHHAGVASELGQDRERARAARLATPPVGERSATIPPANAPLDLEYNPSRETEMVREGLQAYRSEKRDEVSPKRVPGSRHPEPLE